MVEAEVDRRIKEFQTAGSPKRGSLLYLLGSVPYGLADAPREEQIQRGLEYHLSLRRHQRETHAAIVALRASQHPPLE